MTQKVANQLGNMEADLRARRAKLVAFVEDFASTHDIDRMSTEELDLWIERLRPIRLEIHRSDSALKKITGQN